MDAPNRVPLGEHQHVDAVLQVLGMIAEGDAAEPLLVEPQGVHHGAHRPVEDGNAVGQQGVKRINTRGRVGRGHQVWCRSVVAGEKMTSGAEITSFGKSFPAGQ